MDWSHEIKAMFFDWPLGTFLFFAEAFAFLIIVAIIVAALFYIIDSWFLLTKSGVGKITKKEFVPEHSEMLMTYNAATKTCMPFPMHEPDKWSLLIKIGHRSGWISVTKTYYDQRHEDEEVSVNYRIGRISRELYVRSIE